MQKGSRNTFSKLLSGLSILAVLVMSVVQAHAVVLPALHAAIHATEYADHNQNAEIAASLPANDDWESLCKYHGGTHGIACCCASGCAMFGGWLAPEAAALPSITPGSLIYRSLATPPPDGLDQAPALPPPRHVI